MGALQPGTYDTCCQDTFVAKLNSAGSQLLYSTYLEGSGQEDLIGLPSIRQQCLCDWMDGVGQFPVSAVGLPNHYSGNSDVYVTKLNPSASGQASLVYSTFLGGSDVDEALDIKVDGSGSAYVTGDTSSTNFPATAALTGAPPPRAKTPFVVKLNPAGSALTYSALLGGAGSDAGWKVAVDTQGNAYVAGRTASADFPTTAGAYQITEWGSDDVFVAN